MKQIPIYLLTKQKTAGNDPLNHKSSFAVQKIDSARVTELNGAERQISSLGAIYSHTYVIRLNGISNADAVGFGGEFDIKTLKPRYEVNQIRRHKDRTEIYAVGDKVSSDVFK